MGKRKKVTVRGEVMKAFDELDRKFDALCEFLNVEFVDETVSDGSEVGDSKRFYCRKKKNNS